jgi:uncharacterized membrane protein
MEPSEPNDTNYYKLGIFYYNPNDKRVFVPKRFGWGWTLNFASWWTYLIFAVIIGFAVWRGMGSPMP